MSFVSRLIGVGVVGIAGAWSALACDCIGMTPTAAYFQSQAVFSGRVISLTFDQNILKAVIEATHVWKGGRGGLITVRTMSGGGSCGIPFVVDTTYLLYTYRDSAYASSGNDSEWTSVCWRSGRLSLAQEDLQFLSTVESAEENIVSVNPMSFELGQNYPNPFNPSTTIRYAIPNRSHVALSAYNTLGQQLAILVNETQDAGTHEVRFDGSGLASGVYFYRLRAGQYVETRRLLYLK